MNRDAAGPDPALIADLRRRAAARHPDRPGRADALAAALDAPADADLLARLRERALLAQPPPPRAAGRGPRRALGLLRRLALRAVAGHLQAALDHQSRVNLDLIELLERHDRALAAHRAADPGLQRARARLAAPDDAAWLDDRDALAGLPAGALPAAVAGPAILDGDDPAALAAAAAALCRALAPGAALIACPGPHPPAAAAALLLAAGLSSATADAPDGLVTGRR